MSVDLPVRHLLRRAAKAWLVTASLVSAVGAPAPVAAQSTYAVVASFEAPVNGASPRGRLLRASTGRLYGTTSSGGDFNQGTIFTINAAGQLTTIHHFTGGSDGAAPFGGLLEGSDGALYGTTSAGALGHGTVFRLSDEFGMTELMSLHTFTGGTDGATPYGGLLLADDGVMYGTTSAGGAGYGTVFRLAGWSLTPLHSFNGSEGWFPIGTLAQAADGSIYGTTQVGGAIGGGTIFKLAAGAVTTVHNFGGASGGGRPSGALFIAADGSLYGTTAAGNTGHGTIFRRDSSGTVTTLHSFDGGVNGGSPFAGLIRATDGFFYGVAERGGTGTGVGNGTLFRYDTSGGLTTLHRFVGADGIGPLTELVEGADGRLYGTTFTGTGAAVGGTVFGYDVASGTLTTLFAFAGGTTGAAPRGPVTAAPDGTLYGATTKGGAFGKGTIYAVGGSGTLSTVYDFTGGSDGADPWSGLSRGADGSYYGTTAQGGNGYGTIFRIDASGTLTTLHRFSRTDGWYPIGTLLLASDGNFYGTTEVGGAAGESGTIFRITPAGVFTLLQSLGGAGKGGRPRGSLIQASDGHIYGTTAAGNIGHGTVFRLTLAGAMTTIHTFTGLANGSAPFAGLTDGGDGYLYGVTAREGGTSGGGSGTIFRIDTAGTLTTLYRFTGGADGGSPHGGMVKARDGRFYGTTMTGGTGAGTVFAIDPAGVFNTVHSLNGTTDGREPWATLVEGVDGHLYGTAAAGGSTGAGTVFRVRINRPPTADPQSITTPEDTAVALTLTGSDPDNDPLSFTVTSAPMHGTLSGTAPNLVYTPEPNFDGTDSFAFVVNDGTADSAPATVTIEVEAADLSVTLLAPNGGERVFVNVPYEIRWTANDATRFDVALSRDGGVTYTPIAACAALSGAARSCSWLPTTPASTNARIRITASDSTGSVVAVSAASFAIANTTPTVRVTAPNTAIVWALGSRREITWTHNLGATSNVRLEVSRDNGTSWEVLASSVPNTSATAGAFVWLVTGPTTTSARVRVTWTDGPANDISDLAFSIVAPMVAVTAPNTNVNWVIGATQNIRWSHNLGPIDTMRVELSRDNGVSWTTLAANVPNNPSAGTYAWTVTGPVTDGVRVRVSQSGTPAVQDVSDVPSRIGSRIRVTMPNSALMWGAGSLRTVTWTHDYGTGQLFDIHFSGDDGATWVALAAGVSGESHAVRMPTVPTAAARIRVSPAGAFGDGDVSNEAFVLAAPTIAVTAPNTNVNWTIGSTRTIAWSHNLGAAETVDVEVSRDGGVTWSAIGTAVPNTANASGNFSWVVTGPATTAARVRVRWTFDGTVLDISNVNFRVQ